MEFTISLQLNEIQGNLTQQLIATDPHDNEENAKRMADQMITAIFKRWREKNVHDNFRR